MGNIFNKEGTPVSLETSGSAITAGQQAKATTQLDLRSAGNVAEPLSLGFELNAGFASTPSFGETITLVLVPYFDGTNPAAIDTTNHKYQQDHYAGIFEVCLAQTAAQRMTLSGVVLDPRLYDAYLFDTAAENISSGWTLKVIGDEEQYT